MERVSKQPKKITGQQIKECIKRDSVVYQMPIDIWKHFLDRHVDAKTLTLMMRTCRPLYELIKHICENNVRIAWECRKYNQITLAKKWLLCCAENGNTDAMFHLGFAMKNAGGWGYKQNTVQGLYWLKKAGKAGNISAMACCPTFQRDFTGSGDSDNENYWEEAENDEREARILESGNTFAIGYWYYYVDKRIDKAYNFFRKSAEEDNNEYAQYYLANHVDYKEWMKKSADNGFGPAQSMYARQCYTIRDFWFNTHREDPDYEFHDKWDNSARHYKKLADNQSSLY